jgi:hypothetical protein
MEEKHALYNKIMAGVVFAVAFVVYLMTVAPTVAFWDCGEYVASCQSLAVPHPPGNPLYIILGRAWSMATAFLPDVGYRLNLISVVCGAFVALFMYLIAVRTMILLVGTPDTSWKRITVYTAGFVGGLFASFNNTFWFSCVESEVLIPAMLIVVIGTWLALKWAASTDPKRDRYLLLISYLVFLGIGLHMFTMIAMGPVGLLVLMADKEKRTDWRLWVVGLLLMSVIYDIASFFIIGPALVVLAAIYAFTSPQAGRSANAVVFGIAFIARAVMYLKGLSVHGEQFELTAFVQAMIPLGVPFAITLVEVVSVEKSKLQQLKKQWTFIFLLSALALTGYSVHVFLPIRSALQPMIDENHPVVEWKDGHLDWEALRGFLERKQYGSDNMIGRMFHRRGTWAHQFGIDSNMGFGGFHLTQFFHFGPALETDRTTSIFTNYGPARGLLMLMIYLIPTAFMLFGWWYLYKRNKNIAIFLVALVLMGTVMMVFYMNFADGTKSEYRDYVQWVKYGKPGAEPVVHREVRVRDYFFTQGFIFLGLWMGISAGCALHLLFTSKRRGLRNLGPIVAVLFAVSPALPITQNWMAGTRQGDHVPFDYAFNLLMSCEKDGIIFTNGDNDTFPLWALQEAYGIRKDVRIVNLSLVNTNWYIKQLKNLEPKAPITYTDEQIDRLNHQANPFPEAVDYKMTNAGISVRIEGRKERNALRVQDVMVLHIVDANKWKKPIYFAVTVSDDGKMGLDPYLQMQGLVYRLMPHVVPAAERIDVDRTIFMLDRVYNYRGLGDGTTELNETSSKLVTNYAAAYIQVAVEQRRDLATMKAGIDSLQKKLADKATKDTAAVSASLARVKAPYEALLNRTIGLMDGCVGLMPWEWRWRMLRHEFLTNAGRYEEAEKRIREALIVEPKNPDYLKALGQSLMQQGKKSDAEAVWRQLVDVDNNPFEATVMLARTYEEQGLFDSAIAVMKSFQNEHPGDRRAVMYVSQLENARKENAPDEPAVAPKPGK